MKKSEILAILIALIAATIALVQWLFPFNPIGISPLKFLYPNERSTKVSPVEKLKDPQIFVTAVYENIPTQVIANCLPVLFTEDFNSINDATLYRGDNSDNAIYLHDWRLELTPQKARSGVMTASFGQYDSFTLEFYVYPVGEIYDGSVNILFYQHAFGKYEIQVRPRNQEFQIFKERIQNGETHLDGSFGWTKNEAIKLGPYATKFRLETTPGRFTFWVNDQEIYSYLDNDPYLRGDLKIGIGAGEVAPIKMQIDDITVCGR